MAKRSKYGVSPKKDRTYNGTVYMSKLESKYRAFLDIRKKAVSPSERVVCIIEQVPYEIIVNGKKICKYLLDFAVEYADGHVEYIDVKGVKTDIYRLKKKLVEACYPIKITEINKGDF